MVFRKVNMLKAPTKPSKEEVDMYNVTHLPFRSWCRHCVRGRGRNSPHKKNNQKMEEEEEEEVKKQVPRICMDYHFMSQEDERANENPISL